MYICIVIHELYFGLQGKCEVLTGWVLLNIQCGNGNNLSVKVFCISEECGQKCSILNNCEMAEKWRFCGQKKPGKSDFVGRFGRKVDMLKDLTYDR